MFAIRSCPHSGPLTVSADVCSIDSVSLLAELFYLDLRALLTSLYPHPLPIKQHLLIPRLKKGLLGVNTSSSKEKKYLRECSDLFRDGWLKEATTPFKTVCVLLKKSFGIFKPGTYHIGIPFFSTVLKLIKQQMRRLNHSMFKIKAVF